MTDSVGNKMRKSVLRIKYIWDSIKFQVHCVPSEKDYSKLLYTMTLKVAHTEARVLNNGYTYTLVMMIPET